jgi:predicted transcriptional regulator
MSKDLEVLKADVKKLMLKDWTKTEVTKLDEFMEDVIIATMQVNKLPIHIVVGRSEQLKCEHQPSRYDTKYTVCKKCDMVLQMKP